MTEQTNFNPRVQVGYSISIETKDHIDVLAKATFRSQGGLIEWLVAEAWKDYQEKLDMPKEPVSLLS